MKFALALLMVIVRSGWLHAAPAEKPPAPYARVDNDFSEFDLNLVKMNRTFKEVPKNIREKNWVKQKLKHLFETDQYLHDYEETPFKKEYSDAERDYFWKEFPGRWNQVESSNTRELKELIEFYPWFKISEFGAEADNHASTIVQHSDLDLLFQKRMIETLKKLFPIKETDPKNYAYLADRVLAINEKKPQRYGTQGKCAGHGSWQPFPLEDAANVDKFRAEVGLETLAAFEKRFSTICP